jgi:hypothetical protein
LKDFADNSVIKDVGVPTDIKINESVGSVDWFRTLLDIVK